MFNPEIFTGDCALIRETSPLVHNITNYVAMNIAANALLSVGASPVMSFFPDEMPEIVQNSSAVAINIGCLDSQVVKAAKIAAAAAKSFGKKWVLDPVGAGMTGLRTKVACDLALNYSPSVIRGNASEIMSLAASCGIKTGNKASSRGVDSISESSEALECAGKLAILAQTVVCVSGVTDYITDGNRTGKISCGSPLMRRVTAMGCTATAITGAFLAVQTDSFYAALNAMALMGVCGEKAAAGCPGTGTFAVRFQDALSSFEAEAVAEEVR